MAGEIKNLAGEVDSGAEGFHSNHRSSEGNHV
jgi:hypothetical protein